MDSWLFDIGNSSLKVANYARGGLNKVWQFSNLDSLIAAELVPQQARVFYSNVRPGLDLGKLHVAWPAAKNVAELIDRQDLISFDPRLDIGIDRKMACFGALAIAAQPLVVVTAGTATTVSLVSSGRCEKAMIWAGVGLSAESIGKATRIPIGREDLEPAVAQETRPDSLKNSTVVGILCSQAYAIERVAQEWLGRDLIDRQLSVLMTGWYAQLLCSKMRIEARVVDDLVLHGVGQTCQLSTV